MSKMGDLHSETAMDRADSAEREVEYLRDAMLRAHGELVKIRDVMQLAAHPTSVIGADLAHRLGDIAMDLHMGGKHGPA